MPLKNRTPLFCFPFDALTPSGECRSVVVIKATLDILPVDAPRQGQGFTHSLRLSQKQEPVTLVDTPHGEFQKSSLRGECEIAPAKPFCDVIVVGDAHAPGGRPCRRFQAALRVKTPDRKRPVPPGPLAIGPGMDVPMDERRRWESLAAQARANPIPGEVLVDKRLQITGERWLRRRSWPMRSLGWLMKVLSLGLVRWCPWRLSRPQPLTSLPLRYEYAFGGHVRAWSSDLWSGRVPARCCTPGTSKAKLRHAWATKREDGLLAEAWWEENPVGRGFAPLWYVRASRSWRLPAPQIEDPDHPFTPGAAWKAMARRGRAGLHPGLSPQGFGIITRNWASRLTFAGTWGKEWAESGSPYPPDFSTAFNNCAHPETQCRHLLGDEVIELANLFDPATPCADRDARGNQLVRFRLPGLAPFLHLTLASGETRCVPAVLDTLVIEPGPGRLTLLHRASYPEDMTVIHQELRFSSSFPEADDVQP